MPGGVFAAAKHRRAHQKVRSDAENFPPIGPKFSSLAALALRNFARRAATSRERSPAQALRHELANRVVVWVVPYRLQGVGERDEAEGREDSLIPPDVLLALHPPNKRSLGR